MHIYKYNGLCIHNAYICNALASILTALAVSLCKKYIPTNTPHVFHRFHVVSTWNIRGAFVGIFAIHTYTNRCTCIYKR